MRLLPLIAAAIVLWTAPCLADSATLSPAQTDAVNKLIHDYLMNNPKVFAEALAKAEDAAKAEEAADSKQAIESHRSELLSDASSPVMGDPSGDVTLVEFFDYRCPYCKAAAPVMDQLLQAERHVRVVLKEYPILGDDSVYATRVALVAAKHGKYAQVHQALLSFKGKVTPADAANIARDANIDAKTLASEMASPDIDADIKRNVALADTLKIDGTPTFIVGSQSIPGAVTLEDLRAAIDMARHPKS